MSTGLTVWEMLRDYTIDFELRGCRSIKSLRSEMKNLKEFFGEDMYVADIGIRMLKEFQRVMRERGHAAATVNKLLAILSAALSLALENEILEHRLKFPKKLRCAPPRQGYFEYHEYLAIRRELPEWAKDVLTFGYNSGWRWGEVVGLTWDEVDFQNRVVRLSPSRSKNLETRMLPMFAHLEQCLRRRHKVRIGSSPLVFYTVPGKQISSSTWYGAWKRATKRAGYPDKLFHDCRRTMARNLDRAHVRREIAKKWLGHKTDSMYIRYNIITESDVLSSGGQFEQFMAGEEAKSNVIPMFRRES